MNINTTNYEAYFLLYIDNELTATQKLAVDQFVNETPSLQKEFNLLKATVLDAPSIEFEDKALLYRFDEMEATLPKAFKQNLYRTEAPIIKPFFTVKKIRAWAAVAAILILMIGYELLPESKSKVNTLVAADIKLSDEKKPTQINARVLEENTKKDLEKKDIVSTNQQVSTTLVVAKNNLSATTAVSITTTAVSTSIQENAKAIAVNEPIVLPAVSQNAATVVSNNTATVEPIENFEEVNTDNPDRVIYIANMEIDGDKLRGITRRVSAIFKRNRTEKEK